jgi:hypothetical protein
LGLQFLGEADRLQPIRCLSDNAESVAFQKGTKSFSHYLMIIRENDFDWHI